MLKGECRPWGGLDWILDRIKIDDWSLLSCIATESRSLGATTVLRARSRLASDTVIEILDDSDEAPSRYFDESRRLLAARRGEYKALGGDESAIETHQLLERDDLIVQAARAFLQNATDNVIIDISCFPKRFFFPLVKMLYQAPRLRNILASYSVPAAYAKGEPLAEETLPRNHIHSMFVSSYPEPEDRIHIVGVGYEPLGLRQVLEGEQSFQLLFPFPSPPPGFQRNLEFVRELAPYNRTPLIYVNTYDVPGTFDCISALTKNGQRYAILSPYGPKPMSLAMCLYACAHGHKEYPPSVFYTQPTIYNPKYSEGISEDRGQLNVVTYCIRLNGRNLYREPDEGSQAGGDAP